MQFTGGKEIKWLEMVFLNILIYWPGIFIIKFIPHMPTLALESVVVH